MSFNKKNYLILGGSSGIGFAVAQRLTDAGANVVLVSRNANRLILAEKELMGGQNYSYPYDFNNNDNIESIFRFCSSKGILLDGMVFSVGIAPLCLVQDNTLDIMEKVFRINFYSFIELVKYFQLEKYSNNGSKIVAVSSVMSTGAGYRQTLYGSSKAALSSAVKLMAKELLNRKIHINSVAPGVCDTAMLNKLKENSQNLEAKVLENQVLGILSPKQVANAVAFLLSEAADSISGTEILFDGGHSLK